MDQVFLKMTNFKYVKYLNYMILLSFFVLFLFFCFVFYLDGEDLR